MPNNPYLSDEALFAALAPQKLPQCPTVSVSKKHCFRIAGHEGKHYYKRFYVNASGIIKFKRITFTKEGNPNV